MKANVPQLIEALATSSWSARRQVIEQLAGLGSEAAAAMCQSLRVDRRGENRLAGLVDALVASSAAVDELVLTLLDDPNTAVVCDGLQIIGRRRMSVGLARVVQLAGHADDNVSVASIEALGRLGSAEAVDCLLGIVRSHNFFRSFPAIDVLGRLGDTRAVETLLAVLGDPLRGPEAVRALGRLGDETSIDELMRWLLTSPITTSRVAAVALAEIHEQLRRRYGSPIALERALAKHPQKPAIEARLQRALAGADASERRAISNLLGLFSSSASVEQLMALLGEAEEVGVAAASSLGRMARLGNAQVLAQASTLSSAQRAQLLPELAGLVAAVPWFVACLADPDARVRVLACDALSKTGDPSAASALLALLGDADLSVNQAAMAALQSLGSAGIEDLVLAAAVTGPAGRRYAALRILAYFGSQGSLAVLLAAAEDADERVREIVLPGLATIDGERAVRGLLQASEHPSPRTRAAAARALGTVEPTPATLSRLFSATTDPDAWVRYHACQALGNAGDASAAEILAERLIDSAGQVRVAAVDALARLPGPPAREVLERAAQHDDTEVRRAALTGLGISHQPSSLPLLLDAALAPDVATRLVALSSLAKYDSPQALGRIHELARADQDQSVQHAAIELLSELPPASATHVLVELLFVDALRPRAALALTRYAAARAEQLVAALEAASAPVAEALVSVIARLPSQLAERLLLAVLESPNEQARRAAVRALRIAFDGEHVRLRLARSASQDPDPEVRRVAAARLS